MRDTIVNVVLYAPLGVFGYLTFVQHFRKAGATAAVLALALVLSCGIEMAQLFDPSRYCSAFDVVCNLTGTAIGIVAALFYSQSVAPMIARNEIDALLHPRGAAVLLLCWVGYQTMPLFPQLSSTQLLLKIKSLAHPTSWSPVEMAASFVDWLAVAAIVDEVAGPARSNVVSAALILLLPGRLLLDTRSVTGAECIGASLAWISWTGFMHKWNKRLLLLAWLSVGAIVLRGLEPFTFTTAAGTFSWVPFAASLSYEHAAAFVVFFRKCFLYGVPVWLLRKVGFRYIVGAFSIAALLAAIEAAQLHLPDRTAEITDPLLALIMAVILHVSRQHKDSAASRITPGP